MPRRQKKYHYIYKTTCKVNGKYYVGMHSTDDLNDGYTGSGKYLRRSINKYGKENFEVEILEYLDNRKDLINREIEMINEDLLQDLMCMNLRQGGEGGFISDEQQRTRSIAANTALNEKLNTDSVFRKQYMRQHKLGMQKAHAEGRMTGWTENYNWIGKVHKEESKKKTSNNMKGRVGLGSTNSQFGSCWIMNLELKKNKKIPVVELSLWISKGWEKGRKIKF